MRTVLDAAANQSMPSHCRRALQRRCARVAAPQVRTQWATQALVVAFIREVIATLRVRGDRQIVRLGREIEWAPAPPAAHDFGCYQLLVIRVVGAVQRV